MTIMHISNNAWLLARTIVGVQWYGFIMHIAYCIPSHVVPSIICVIRVLWRCGCEHFWLVLASGKLFWWRFISCFVCFCSLDSPLACLEKNLLARSVKNLPPIIRFKFGDTVELPQKLCQFHAPLLHDELKTNTHRFVLLTYYIVHL